VSPLQTFGLKVFVFAADAAKTKELRERNQPFDVVGVGRRKLLTLDEGPSLETSSFCLFFKVVI
jgi:hypothetical protein